MRELREQAREERGHLRVAEVAEEALAEGPARLERLRSWRLGLLPPPANGGGERLEPEPDQVRGARDLDREERRLGGREQRRDPDRRASVQTACPHETPSAVKIPARRPPISELRIVSAVSGPGVTITIADTPRNATSSVTPAVSQFRIVAPRCGPDGR